MTNVKRNNSYIQPSKPFWDEQVFTSNRTFDNVFLEHKTDIIQKVDFFLNKNRMVRPKRHFLQPWYWTTWKILYYKTCTTAKPSTKKSYALSHLQRFFYCTTRHAQSLIHKLMTHLLSPLVIFTSHIAKISFIKNHFDGTLKLLH